MKNIHIKIVSLVLAVIAGGVGLAMRDNPMLWHYFYALLDAPVCTLNVSQKIGVDPTYSAIVRYAKESVKPGMSRDDVYMALRKIAPVIAEPENEVEEMVLQMCSSPLNNLVFWAYYTSNGKLIKIERDSFP